MAYKVFTAGSLATASDVNTYLMNQSVMVFTNTTARDAALTSVTDGMLTFQTSDDSFTIRDNGAWVNIDMAWKTYTPTFTNYTLNNGTVTARYLQIGKIVHVYVTSTMGSSTIVSGQITFTLPITSQGAAAFGLSEMTVAGTVYPGYCRTLSTTTAGLYVHNASGTYASRTAVSSTIPNTWASGNLFTTYLTYQGA